MIAIDTNLLVYAHRSRTPEHARARKAIARAAAGDDGWGIAVASLTEFWTHDRRFLKIPGLRLHDPL